MKRVIGFLILIFLFLIVPFMAMAQYQEQDLPHEAAPRSPKDFRVDPENMITFNGYINSQEVTVVADVMGCVFNLCRTQQEEFCADEQGVLVIGADDTGRVVEILKDMENALNNGIMVQVFLTREPYYAGAKRVVEVRKQY